MIEYTSIRLIDSKPKEVVVDEAGNIVNKNPAKDQLKGLKKESYKMKTENRSRKYTKEEMLHSLRQLYEKYRRPLTSEDFVNNPGYPSLTTYKNVFGSFQKALKLVGLDIESIIKKGVIKTPSQKARLSEILIRDHFKTRPVDLAGDNYTSHCDGICPNGKIYDVKSSKLRKLLTKGSYTFVTRNKYKEKIELYYLLAFNDKDYKKLDYGWRIPGEIVENDEFYVGTYYAKFNIHNMKQYDITDKLTEVLREYGFLK